MRGYTGLTAVSLLIAATLVLASPTTAANPVCTGPQGAVTITGNLKAGPGCVLNGTTVTRDVIVQANGDLDTNGATIGGSLQIVGTSLSNAICDTQVGGTILVRRSSGTTTLGGGACSDGNESRFVEISKNTGPVDVASSQVAKDLTVANNTTGTPVTISATAVGRDLACSGNSPAPQVDTDTTVERRTTGTQCATHAQTQCPRAGCTLSASDATTSVTVVVPGGGQRGPLKITISAPPTDDGCLGPGPSAPVGSVVTVVPPGGYRRANPIVVTVTWPFTGPPIAECKSTSGARPYEALPHCTPGNPPPNVPCWKEGPGPQDVRAYISSRDPAFTGH